MRERSERQGRRYAAIPNAAMRDDRVSIDARGMLALLMTYADDWTFRRDHLMKVSGIGRDRFQRIMGELEDRGYVRRDRERGEDGRVSGSTWIIVDEPEITEGLKTRSSVTEGLKNRPPVEPAAGESGPLRKTKIQEYKQEEEKTRERDDGKLPFSEDWQPSDEVLGWGRAQGYGDEELERQRLACALHYMASGQLYVCRSALFKSWLINGKKPKATKRTKRRPLTSDELIARMGRV